MDIRHIQRKLREFAEERDWEQFHSPKNLTMALAGEAAELLEIFQWLTEEQSRDIVDSERDMEAVREEMADVLIYLVRLADKLGVDLEAEVHRKMEINGRKYPASTSRGSARKYNRRG